MRFVIAALLLISLNAIQTTRADAVQIIAASDAQILPPNVFTGLPGLVSAAGNGGTASLAAWTFGLSAIPTSAVIVSASISGTSVSGSGPDSSTSFFGFVDNGVIELSDPGTGGLFGELPFPNGVQNGSPFEVILNDLTFLTAAHSQGEHFGVYTTTPTFASVWTAAGLANTNPLFSPGTLNVQYVPLPGAAVLFLSLCSVLAGLRIRRMASR
ncbi:MAG: hypothetical protein AAF493_03400 [Pseudomonadota bacterium]